MAEVDSTLEVTKYLQTSLPYVDQDRTAIWGWSYGGYLSLSTLISDKQNIFKCGASVAPVTDWTLYDTYYTERYMGLLDDNINGYNRARVFHKLNNLSKYNKKYFVAHGTHDDNVHFQQSMVSFQRPFAYSIHPVKFNSNQNSSFYIVFCISVTLSCS